ncbi:MAG TPA: hypothetical protein VJC16_06345 [Candidatus Nanoarchaeia archaeon]|nr:hypothetical protein [Candidatus Nanoarchaeia archaeon]
MKLMRGLRNPDIVTVNGQRFQVIENTGLFYDTKRKELEMAVTLVRLGENRLAPRYRLVYIHERPERVRFFVWDKKKWKERTLRSLKLAHQKL